MIFMQLTQLAWGFFSKIPHPFGNFISLLWRGVWIFFSRNSLNNDKLGNRQTKGSSHFPNFAIMHESLVGNMCFQLLPCYGSLFTLLKAYSKHIQKIQCTLYFETSTRHV